jgi:tight adherence protein B
MIAVALLACLALGIVALLTLESEASRERRLRERAGGTARRRPLHAVRRRLNRGLLRTPAGRKLERRLLGAGMSVLPIDAVLRVVAADLAMVIALRPLFGTIGSVVLALSGIALASRWLDGRRRKRLEALIAQLPDLARTLSNAAGAGLSLPSAVTLAAGELADPAGTELRSVRADLELGRPLPEALQLLTERMPSRELQVLVQTLVIQTRSGGALVSALGNIAETLDQRKELRRELRTAVSAAVFSSYAVVALGVLAVVVMNLFTPGALDQLAQSLPGRIVMGVAGSFFTVGLLLIRRIVRVEV